MKRYKKTHLFLWCLAIILGCISLGMLVKIYFPYNKPSVKDISDFEENKINVEKMKGNYEYASETIYIGDPHITGVLFDYPFKKSDRYIQNKDYIKRIGQEEVNKLIDVTTKFHKAFFDFSYRIIKEENQKFISDKLAQGLHVFYKSGTSLEDKDVFLEHWYRWCKENNISMRAEYISDKSLCFYDKNKEIVRGLLLLKIYECKNPTIMEEELGMEKGSFKLGEQMAIIIDTEFVTYSLDGGRETSKIDSIEIIDIIRGN